MPKIFLWAWERPEDLSFIDPQKVGVAFLAKTIDIYDNKLIIHPRLQPMKVPPGTWLIGVVRIETAGKLQLALSPDQMKRATENILGVCGITGVRGIQIDFDVKVSERKFFTELIDSLHSKLPDSIPLTITALASWCIYDTWIADLPVADAVPMIFRLGPDHDEIFRYLASGRKFVPPICQESIGISTDEPLPQIPRGSRLYIFTPHSWTSQAFQSIMEKIDL